MASERVSDAQCNEKAGKMDVLIIITKAREEWGGLERFCTPCINASMPCLTSMLALASRKKREAIEKWRVRMNIF